VDWSSLVRGNGELCLCYDFVGWSIFEQAFCKNRRKTFRITKIKLKWKPRTSDASTLIHACATLLSTDIEYSAVVKRWTMLLPFLIRYCRWLWIQNVISRLGQREIRQEWPSWVDVVANIFVKVLVNRLALLRVAAEHLKVLPGLISHSVIIQKQRSQRVQFCFLKAN
jgi:hypothetical protein